MINTMEASVEIDSKSEQMQKQFEELCKYLDRGWYLLPVDYKKKRPLIKDWINQASNDANQIKAWLRKFPGCGWGVLTGEKSRIIAIDLDVRNGKKGFKDWDKLIADHDKLETKPLSYSTPSGGGRLLFQYPEGKNIRKSEGELAKGIDVQANGACSLIPPTPGYEWDEGFDPETISELPEWLVELLEVSNQTTTTPPIFSKNTSQSNIQIIPYGVRNSALFHKAYALHADELTREEINSALCQMVNDRVEDVPDDPLTDYELETLIDSAISYEAGKYPRTDLGNAYRFVSLQGHEVRYIYDWNDWLIWDGRRWKIDNLGLNRKLAQMTTESILAEARLMTDSKHSEELTKWGFKSQEHHVIIDMLEQAKPLLSMDHNVLDQHPDLLNVSNGVLDLRTGELFSHNQDYWFTKIADVKYNPEAKCPKWFEFLNLIAPDREVQFYLQKAAGYSLSGYADRRIFFFVYGDVARGKTTFVETLLTILGEYGKRIDIEALLDSAGRGQGPTPYTADLFGARIIISSETPDNRRLNSRFLKAVTGGAEIVANPKYKKVFRFRPACTLWIEGNYKPKITDDGDAFWERMKLVPFDVSIPKEIRRPLNEVLDEFKEESSGILNWMLRGYQMLLKVGIYEPEIIQRAVQDYRDEQNEFKHFVEECLDFNPKFKTKKQVINNAYRNWCKENGIRHPKGQRFVTEQLVKRYEAKNLDRKDYAGVRLSEPISSDGSFM